LIFISIFRENISFQGRNFPNQSSCQVTVDAKFDGEVLITDPVEFTSTPDINQELAWELDKKTFQQHKLQRSVIKCNAYSTTSTGQRENLGYFILDVRSLNTTRVMKFFEINDEKLKILFLENSLASIITNKISKIKIRI
jgi:hypothetical protein